MGISKVRLDTAQNGHEACKKYHDVTNLGESYAIIITDIAMPVMDGLRAAEIIRMHMSQGTETPIIAVSSWDTLQPPLSVRADCSEVFAVKVLKPLTHAKAQKFIEKFLSSPDEVKSIKLPVREVRRRVAPTNLAVPASTGSWHSFSVSSIDAGSCSFEGYSKGPAKEMPMKDVVAAALVALSSEKDEHDAKIGQARFSSTTRVLSGEACGEGCPALRIVIPDQDEGRRTASPGSVSASF